MNVKIILKNQINCNSFPEKKYKLENLRKGMKYLSLTIFLNIWSLASCKLSFEEIKEVLDDLKTGSRA